MRGFPDCRQTGGVLLNAHEHAFGDRECDKIIHDTTFYQCPVGSEEFGLPDVSYVSIILIVLCDRFLLVPRVEGNVWFAVLRGGCC